MKSYYLLQITNVFDENFANKFIHNKFVTKKHGFLKRNIIINSAFK